MMTRNCWIVRLTAVSIVVSMGSMIVNSAPMIVNPVDPLQKLFDGSKYTDVIKALSDSGMEKLPRHHRPQAYLLLGLSYQARGQIDKALGVFQVAAELFPEDINILSHLAATLHAEGLDDRARPIYDKILKMHPHNASAHLGVAEIEHSQGFWESAAGHYRECLNEWKTNSAVWRKLAEVLTERRDFAGAVDAINHSLSLDSDSVDSLKVLAVLEFRQGSHEAAYSTLEKALANSGHRAADRRMRWELSLQYALWRLEDQDLDRSLALADSVLRESPQDALALWIRGMISAKRGDLLSARRDMQTAAANERETPFVAQAADSVMKQIAH